MHQNTRSVSKVMAASIGLRAIRTTGIMLLLIVFSTQAQASSVPTDNADQFVEKHFIIGGEPVERNTYPWMVALAYNVDADLVQRQFCGGSIIADQWVLTAAHCLYGRSGAPIRTDAFKVAINVTNLNDPNVPELDVANIYIHPAYDHNGRNPHSDIALLELAQPTGITPMTLSTKPTDKLIGLQSTAIGWGAVDNSNPAEPQFPVWLHTVDVPIVSMDECNAPESYAENIYPNQLCAGFKAGGKDSCVGDSGGPLIATIDGVVQQVGVVSFGFGCALPNYYGIYTDVPYFIGWINQYVFVGEREFEPELFEAKGTTVIKNSGTTVSSGATSFFVIFTLLTGILIRRRSC